MILRNEYPRPQLKRDSWISLNGIWQFGYDNETDEKKIFSSDLSTEIVVPFAYQCEESGIGDVSYHKTIWYKKEFSLSEAQLKRRALLCFNAADYKCDVWVNGLHVVCHEGGFTPFSVDISHTLKAKNVVAVKCEDDLSVSVPRGKQSWTNEKFACWYVPTSGIWQSVWLEFFDVDCLESYTLKTDIDSCSFGGELTTLYGVAKSCKMTVKYGDKIIKMQKFSLDGKHTRFSVSLMESDFVDESFWWTPEKPNLFYLDIELYNGDAIFDVLHTRFGMRKISVRDGKILLNNRPYYQRLILDQGYFAESGLTPPTCESLKNDIILAKQMGYNGARKHQKFEDPYFYYYADELGFLTWCEMPSAYNFNAEEQYRLLNEWQDIVKNAKNFTSIVCYVPLNESWGVRKILSDKNQQDFARAMYYATKAQDETRPVSINDGWENIEQTDIVSIHDYSYDGDGFADKYRRENFSEVYLHQRKLMAFGNEYKGQPVVFSEFGGIALKKDSVGGGWGYNDGAADSKEFYDRYENLLRTVSALDFSGFCYTQLTDVQQEVNGLLDEHHRPKFDLDTIKMLTRVKKNVNEI